MSKRDYPDRPMLSVGAVVLRGDLVLLVKRGREPMKGRWSVPGGMMEAGETAAEAATREVLEETGITCAAIDTVDIVEAITRDEAGRVRWHFVILEVAARWVSGDPVAGDDADEAIWATPEELAALNLTPRTHAVIEEARARLADR